MIFSKTIAKRIFRDLNWENNSGAVDVTAEDSKCKLEYVLTGRWPNENFENIYLIIQIILKIYHVPGTWGKNKRIGG